MGFVGSSFTVLTSTSKARMSTVSHFSGSSWAPGTPSAYTQPSLSMKSASVLADHSGAAMKFFTSIRIPSALIAGSSLGALFIMVKAVNSRAEQEKESRLRKSLLFVYHALSLTSLLLSLNVIVVATSAFNTLLIGNLDPMATSPYEFLRREFFYEYVMTRWSFFTAIICFTKAVGCRALLEFDLLRKERIRPAMLVIFSMTALVAHIFHIVNDVLYTYPNFWLMTIGLLKVRTKARVSCVTCFVFLMQKMSSCISSGFFVKSGIRC